METINIEIGKKKYNVALARTSDEKEQGLMGVETLPEDRGMLFDYSDKPQQEISFWMKNTLIPLDIVFINNQGIVVAVEQGDPESEELITCVADEDELLIYVLEGNANSGINVGDRFKIAQEEVFEKGIVDKDELEDVEDVSEDEIKMFILDAKGSPVHEIEAGVRLFSRIHTRELIRLVKHAHKTKQDSDYKRIAKRLFKILNIQDTQKPEYVDAPDGDKIEKKENA